MPWVRPPVVIHRSTPALEAPEIAGYRDLWAAAPDALVARYGLAHAQAAGAHCTAARAFPGMRLLNHALGVADGPEVSDVLDAVERFFTAHGGSALVAVPEGAPAEAALAARGYERDHGWVKFARPVVPVPGLASAFGTRRSRADSHGPRGRPRRTRPPGRRRGRFRRDR